MGQESRFDEIDRRLSGIAAQLGAVGGNATNGPRFDEIDRRLTTIQTAVSDLFTGQDEIQGATRALAGSISAKLDQILANQKTIIDLLEEPPTPPVITSIVMELGIPEPQPVTVLSPLAGG